MLIVYLLIILGLAIFVMINILLVSYHILQVSFILAIVLEIMALFICFGPQIILYYVMKVKNSIESYTYLYEQYEIMKNSVEELENQIAFDKKQYKDKLLKATDVSYRVIEEQKDKINDLNSSLENIKYLNGRLNNEVFEKNKEIELLKIENKSLKNIKKEE